MIRKIFEWIGFLIEMLIGFLLIIAGLLKILLAGCILFLILYFIYLMF